MLRWTLTMKTSTLKTHNDVADSGKIISAIARTTSFNILLYAFVRGKKSVDVLSCIQGSSTAHT